MFFLIVLMMILNFFIVSWLVVMMVLVFGICRCMYMLWMRLLCCLMFMFYISRFLVVFGLVFISLVNVCVWFSLFLRWVVFSMLFVLVDIMVCSVLDVCVFVWLCVGCDVDGFCVGVVVVVEMLWWIGVMLGLW